MKKLKLAIPFYVTANEDAVAMGKNVHPIYLENAKNIIFASLRVENILASGIGRYFFGENHKQRKLLDELIVSTGSFSFSEKRKTFLTIASEQNILSGKDRSEYETLIASIIRYRNMFTHGTAVFNGDSCVLHYFEGKKVEKELTDVFLEKVESDMEKCFRKSEEIMMKININT